MFFYGGLVNFNQSSQPDQLRDIMITICIAMEIKQNKETKREEEAAEEDNRGRERGGAVRYRSAPSRTQPSLTAAQCVIYRRINYINYDG